MKSKILLINPPTGLYLREDRCQAPVKSMMAQGVRPPMDLAYIAAVCRRDSNSTCLIKDYPVEGGGWNEFRVLLRNFRPDYLVISTTTPTFQDDMKAAEIAHEEMGNRIKCIAKGAHLSDHDIEALNRYSTLDYAVRGESELVTGDLISGIDPAQITGLTYRSVSGEVIRNPERELLENLDILPEPDRDLIRNELYPDPETGEPLTPILTSRGCSGQCIFCPVFLVSGKRIRKRSVSSIMAEINSCVNNYGIRSFLFRSDTFTIDKQWVIELCRSISESGHAIRWGANSRIDTFDEERADAMAGAGCYIVSFGVESGSQGMIVKMKKNINLDDVSRAVDLCRNHGILSMLYFVIGLPWETRDTIRETVEFAKRIPADFYEIHSAYPFPGTPLYELGLKEGLFCEDDLEKGNYFLPVMNTYHLTRQEIARARKKALISIYMRPSIIWRTLKRIRSCRKLWRYITFGLSKFINLKGNQQFE